MYVRGERECKACGARWSYYETSSVACPECGSVRSVGVDEPARHTDTATGLDLEEARSAAADRPVRDAAPVAASAAREYLRRRGFVDGGALTDLDATYLAARELEQVAEAVGAALAVDDEVERYFLALLEGADDGERPDADAVPDALAPARGLAAARAVEVYRRDCHTWLEDRETPPGARDLLDALDDHVRRTKALDGDVPVEQSDRLVAAAREVGVYLRDEEAAALESARERLDRLG